MKSLRRSLRALVSLCCGSLLATTTEAQTPPMRILPLEDSLTSGTTIQGAYRNRLHGLLTAAGYNVDFIGTQSDTANPTLPDTNHQGMGAIGSIRSGAEFGDG